MGRESLPRIGFGTHNATGQEGIHAVASALDSGYRHIDTAEMYENQDEVGAALANASVDRDAVFLATKINSPNLAFDDVLDHAAMCRTRLGVDVIDLLYVHWPIRAYDAEETLAAFDELVDRGWIRRVGLSNFTPELLEEAIDMLDAPVFAHQVECHPFLQQRELRHLADEHGHHLVAYAPLAQGRVLDEPQLVSIGEKYDASPTQITLAWLLAKDGVVPIPRSTSEAHIRENRAATDLELDPSTIARIDDLDRGERVVDFPAAPWNRT